VQRYAWLLGGLAVAAVCGTVCVTETARAAPASASRGRIANVGSGDLSLITEPGPGDRPFLAAVQSARSSADVVMYELSDPAFERALASAQKRGVNVRVLLNGGYYGAGSPANDAAYGYLRANGVSVRWSPSRFALTHQKTLVVDDKTAYIMTLNLVDEDYSTSRDFAVADTNNQDVAAIQATFTADWNDQAITPAAGVDLVWSPGALASQLSLIGSARQTLDIYNEEMDDTAVTSALEAAARRGVDVEVVMTASSTWDSAFTELIRAGAHVRTYAPDASLYIHAKMILVDGRRAFLGSQNFSAGSLDDNRELGIIVSAGPVIRSLKGTFASDYAHATPWSLWRSLSELDTRLGGNHQDRAAGAVQLVADFSGDDHATFRSARLRSDDDQIDRSRVGVDDRRAELRSQRGGRRPRVIVDRAGERDGDRPDRAVGLGSQPGRRDGDRDRSALEQSLG
jgi:cardiolipin synthase A/B